ncbi:hypothetical protein KAU32_02540 [bacterium]|nr:hypothetical protein [bacterium]
MKQRTTRIIASGFLLILLFVHIFFWFSRPGFTAAEGLSYRSAAGMGILMYIFQFLEHYLGIFGSRAAGLFFFILFAVIISLKKGVFTALLYTAAMLSVPILNFHIRIFCFMHAAIIVFFFSSYLKGKMKLLTPLLSPIAAIMRLGEGGTDRIDLIGAFTGIAIFLFFSPFGILASSGIIIMTLLWVLARRSRIVLNVVILAFLAVVSLVSLEFVPVISHTAAMITVLLLFYSFNTKALRTSVLLISGAFIILGFLGITLRPVSFDLKGADYMKTSLLSIPHKNIKEFSPYLNNAILSEELFFLGEENCISFPDLNNQTPPEQYRYLIIDPFLSKAISKNPTGLTRFRRWEAVLGSSSGNIRSAVFENPYYYLLGMIDYIDDRVTDESVLLSPEAYALFKGNGISINKVLFFESNTNFLMKTKFILMKKSMLDGRGGGLLRGIKARLDYEKWKVVMEEGEHILLRNPAM